MAGTDRLYREMRSVLSEFTGRGYFLFNILTVEHLVTAMKLLISSHTMLDLVARLVNAVFNLGIADRDVTPRLVRTNDHVKSTRLTEIVAAYDDALPIKDLRNGGTMRCIEERAGALAAKGDITSMPIVLAGLIDPVAPGIVGSFARPGGNVTGITFGVGGTGIGGKWVELLEAAPNVSHAAAVWDSANRSAGPLVQEMQAAARTLNMRLDVLDAGNPTKLDNALAAIGTSGARGVIVTADAFLAATAPSSFNSPQAGASLQSISPGTSSSMPGAHVSRFEYRGVVPPGRNVRGQDPQGSEAGRPSHRAANHVRSHARATRRTRPPAR